MLDELSEGELLLDSWEGENGIRLVMTYKRLQARAWYNAATGIVEVSDGDGPWVGKDHTFRSPSEAACAVADAINGHNVRA